MGADGRHDGRLGPDGAPRGARRRPLERETLNERRYAHELTLIEAEELRPGISDYLAAAERLGLKRAIVSSSSRRWIDMHLERVERAVGWDAIVTAEHDAAGEAAPDAVSRGARAARRPRRRGDRVRGLAERRARREGRRDLRRRDPERGDARLGLDEADLVVDSLADLPPDELVARFT